MPSALPRVPQSPSYSYFRPNESLWSAFGRSMCSVLEATFCSILPLALGAEPELPCSSQSFLQSWALPEGKDGSPPDLHASRSPAGD